MAAPDDAIEVIRCSACGHETGADARFCSSCGARLTAQEAAEERKLVSVLFVDLVGFTMRSDGVDPEDVRDVLRLYHADVKERIEEYGGVVEKFIGDAVMAVFGVPSAHGDDAERAVRAGLRVVASIEELNRAHGLDLAVRAAVTTGDAVVAPGADKTGEALAMGDVVNTASRLQSSAPVGGLIVGADTHRATRHAITYEPLPRVAAKGKATPIDAWLAVAPSTAPAERPLRANPLVGRSREVELMHSLWTRSVEERRPHLVTVIGPPGIGKSRLCREIAGLIESDGGRIVRGRSLPYEEQTGYEAFSHLVRNVSDILDSDSSAVMREKLQTTVERLLPPVEVTDTARCLGLILGLRVDEPVDDVGLLYLAARRFVESLALEQPTLLVFEDLHWARESELSLLEYLVKHVRGTPAMLVATARPELVDAHPGWGSGLVGHTTIPLDPLGEAEAATLAAATGAAAARDLDIERLVEVAEGNPLFIEELVASVVELGESADIPVTVRAAIASRIDVLPAEPRTALLAAAVIGRTFWSDLVAAASGIERSEDALAVLEGRDFVRRDPTSQIGGTAQYTFKHTLIREVAYSTVPRAARSRLHASVARYIEEVIEESTEFLAWVLAHHWAEAGEPGRAIPYLLAAAEAALRGWAHGAVVDLYTQALDLAEDDESRRSIRLRRGLALVELGDFGRASEELGGLVLELRGRELFDALMGQGIATHWLELHEETMAIAVRARQVASELGSAGERAAADALLSQAHAMRGADGDMERALELGERALELWPSGARPFDLANHLHLLADFAYWAGRYERSAELSVQAQARATDVYSPEALLRGGGTEALALTALGRHEEAIGLWDELLGLARELGRNPRTVLNYSSIAYRELLDLDEARRRSEEALELSAAEGFGMPRRFAQSDLIQTYLLTGDIGRAQAAWPGYWQGAEGATAWTRWLVYGRLAVARAEIALRAESPETAVEWAQRAREIAVRTKRRKYEGRSLTILGQALAALGRREEALAELRRGVSIADELIGPPGRWDARSALGASAYELGLDDVAAAAYGEAAELVESFAATLAPERAERLVAAPTTARLLSAAGRRTGTP